MGESKSSNTNSEKEKLSIPVMLFCIVGVVLVGLGVMLLKDSKLKLNIIPSTGSVTSIQTASDSEGNTVYSVVVGYSTTSGNYTANIALESLDNIQMGSQMILYYDFFTPESVSQNISGWGGYVSFIVGIILVVKTLPRFLRIIRDNYLIGD